MTNACRLPLFAALLVLVVACVRRPPAVFRDARDRAEYGRRVVAGTVWMTRNLTVTVPGSWCYADALVSCAAEGRLYAWRVARASCPAGWRLPTDEDWLALLNAFGGHYVLAERRAVGSPEAAYSALMMGGRAGLGFRLSGWRDTLSAGRSADLAEDGLYWSESNAGPDSVSVFVFNRHYGRVLRDRGSTDLAASVRCVSPQ